MNPLSRRPVPLALAAALLPAALAAQEPDPLVAPYPAAECPSCAEWNAPQAPFHVHGSTYYVGTRGLAALLIASPEGHVLLDGGLPDSAPLILESIRSLGFDPADVELIVNSHAHFDHAGGIAALRRATGARVAASRDAAPALEGGSSRADDPQHGILSDFPSVPVAERFDDGGTLAVGPISLTAHLTPGHSPGGTSWSWRSCEASGECLDLVFADSQTPISADGYRFSDHPVAVLAFERGLAALEALPCDLLITPHPGASSLWERREAGELADPEACRRYAASAREQLRARLQREGARPGR